MSQPKQALPRPSHGCCLLRALIKFIAVFIIVLGIVTVVLWIALRPCEIEVHVENASLAQFNQTNGTALIYIYNLTLEMSVRNPNKRIGVYYDRMEAGANSDGIRFGFVPLPTFYQEKKNTTTLYPFFVGQPFIAAEDYTVQEDFNTKMNPMIDVIINGRTSFKIGSYRTKHYKSKFECESIFPSVANGSIGNGFSRIECDVAVWYW